MLHVVHNQQGLAGCHFIPAESGASTLPPLPLSFQMPLTKGSGPLDCLPRRANTRAGASSTTQERGGFWRMYDSLLLNRVQRRGQGENLLCWLLFPLFLRSLWMKVHVFFEIKILWTYWNSLCQDWKSTSTVHFSNRPTTQHRLTFFLLRTKLNTCRKEHFQIRNTIQYREQVLGG